MTVSQKGEIGDISLGREELFPPVRKVLIKPAYPTLENNFSLQEMVAQAVGGNVPVDICSLRELAPIALQKVEQMTMILVSNRITAFESGDTTASLYGVAFDIGSTTVAGMLVEERCHKIASQAGFIELANHEGFKNRFIKNLAFPEVSK